MSILQEWPGCTSQHVISLKRGGGGCALEHVAEAATLEPSRVCGLGAPKSGNNTARPWCIIVVMAMANRMTGHEVLVRTGVSMPGRYPGDQGGLRWHRGAEKGLSLSLLECAAWSSTLNVARVRSYFSHRSARSWVAIAAKSTHVDTRRHARCLGVWCCSTANVKRYHSPRRQRNFCLMQ